MKISSFVFVLCVALLVILQISSVFAENGSGRSEGNESDDENDDDSDDENDDDSDDENGVVNYAKGEEKFKDANGFEIKKKYEVETKIVNGKEVSYVKYESEIKGRKGVEAEIKLEAEGDSEQEILKAVLSNGERKEIKIMPEQVADRALQALKTNEFEIRIREKEHKNVPRVVYLIESNKSGRFLGVFKLRMKVEGEIDAETGEFIGISKPWWAFLVSGEDSDQTDEDSEEKLEVKAKISGNETEAEISLEFETAEENLSSIVQDIDSRLSISEEELQEIIEFEDESDEFVEKAKLEVKDSGEVREVKFEYRYIISSSDEQEIYSNIIERMNSLSFSDLEAIFSGEYTFP